MRLVKLTERSGECIYVNPAQVIAMIDAWIDAWRAERARQETPRRRLVAVDGDVWGWS